MKKLLFYIFLFSIGGMMLMQCSKKNEPGTNTQLFITLKDTSGSVVSGARIRLYTLPGDSGLIQFSDSNGTALFSNLFEGQYYWIAEKGCKNNLNDRMTTTRPLVRGTVSYGYSTLSETGTLKIINTSGEPYLVKDSLFTITLNDTPFINHPFIGPHLIHSEKISTPGIGKDTLIQINCADTTFLTLPY